MFLDKFIINHLQFTLLKHNNNFENGQEIQFYSKN
jgi:hypothetical protein